MNNAEKIEAIRKLLDKPNCVEVEMTRIEEGKQVTRTLRRKVNLMEELEILDYRPTPIKLEPLNVGDRVWCKGELGNVTGTPRDFNGFMFEVESDNGGFASAQRHKLIEVEL